MHTHVPDLNPYELPGMVDLTLTPGPATGKIEDVEGEKRMLG